MSGTENNDSKYLHVPFLTNLTIEHACRQIVCKPTHDAMFQSTKWLPKATLLLETLDIITVFSLSSFRHKHGQVFTKVSSFKRKKYSLFINIIFIIY